MCIYFSTISLETFQLYGLWNLLQDVTSTEYGSDLPFPTTWNGAKNRRKNMDKLPPSTGEPDFERTINSITELSISKVKNVGQKL